MKRYWLLATLIPFCVIAMGTYYVSGTADQKPEYELKTMKGLESDAAGLQITVNMDGITTTVSTKGNESDVEQLSYLARLDAESYYEDDLKRLVKEHRSFMRGKNDVNAFYEDDQVLAYVGTEAHNDVTKKQSNQLTISIMGKLDEGTSSFHVLTDKKNDEYINIHDVQVKDQIMKVLVNRMRTDKYPQFYHVGYDMYTIDLTSQSLLKSEQILSAETQVNEISTWYISGNARISPTGYAIFDRSENKIVDKVESRTVQRNEGLVNREIRVYDIWNGQWRTLQNEQLHHFLMEDNSMGMSIQYANQELSLAAISENKDTHVMVVNVAENKVIRDVQVPLQAIQKEWGRVNYSLVEKDRLYLLMSGRGRPEPNAAIVELQTGNILYQGEIERKNLKSIGYINANGIKVQN
ncbi:hypothetical protein [Paenibacillus qinlingensis]|uniref:hypothetical protein n=1 Tax=Paenibacillus qinlingensis TaxID=1837343 RepID=UPI0015647AF4|nr:hypothetical protein [Paenibacillus qinlingensis]NQX62350.1 hypothetical protein [Paenibacillus qinlingensis]